MATSSDNLNRYMLHGTAVGVQSFVPALAAQLQHALGEFAVKIWDVGTLPISGTVWPYEQSHVMKYMSPNARRVAGNCDRLELYEENERFWLVDDRWGICEMNLLKGTWRSWILPNPQLDTIRCVQMSMLWPMAQLLRARGLYLVPAAAVTLAGRSFLILSPFGLEPELTALIRGGYRVIGQCWTAIREEAGRFAMLHLPGHVERTIPPGMRLSSDPIPAWVDLTREYLNAEQQRAWCDAILLVEPGRRPRANLRPLDRARAVQVLRASWPIFELHPNRRHGQLPARLAQKVPTYQSHLSREPRDLLKMLATLPIARTEAPARVAV